MSRRRAAAGPALSALRVAIDAHDLVRDRRGIGRYLRAVVRMWLRRDDVEPLLVVRDPLAVRFAGAFARALHAPHIRLHAAIPRAADVVWHPWNGTFLTTTKPAVATIHDVAPFVDPPAGDGAAQREQAPFRRSFTSARRFIAVSSFTRDELVRVAGLDPARIAVIHHGVDAVFAPGTSADVPVPLRGRPFVLHIGAHDARKNVPTLVAAFQRAFPDGAARLALTRALAAPVRDAVALPDLDEDALAATYRAATALALPSTYEGFGFPLLEAMASGTPVIAARAASLPEIGGDAAYWVEPATDVTAWETALRAIVNDAALRATYCERGLARAAAFDWNRCASATLEVLRLAAGGA